MFELVEGNWYLIRNDKGFNVSVQRCINGKLGGMATVESIIDMGGTVHTCVVLSSEEYVQAITDAKVEALAMLGKALGEDDE